MIKARSLRGMDAEELETRLKELKEELFNLRFQHATGQLDNPMKIKETRRDIARVCTVMTEREYGIHPEAFEEAGRLPEFESIEEPEEMAAVETEAEELEDAEELAEEAVDVAETEEQLEEEVEDELKDI